MNLQNIQTKDIEKRSKNFFEKIEFFPSFIRYESGIPIVTLKDKSEVQECILGNNGFLDKLLQNKYFSHLEYGFVAFEYDQGRKYFVSNYFSTDRVDKIKDNLKEVIDYSIFCNTTFSDLMMTKKDKNVLSTVLAMHVFAKGNFQIDLMTYLSKVSSNASKSVRYFLKQKGMFIHIYIPEMNFLTKSILEATSETFFWNKIDLDFYRIETQYLKNIEKDLKKLLI